MRPFKFLTSNKLQLYDGNIYEEMIISIYKDCHQNGMPFIGRMHSFRMGGGSQTMIITDLRHNVTDGILYFDYVLRSNGLSYNHVFRIPVDDFERAIQR